MWRAFFTTREALQFLISADCLLCLHSMLQARALAVNAKLIRVGCNAGLIVPFRAGGGEAKRK